jgi:hypothetical protein
MPIATPTRRTVASNDIRDATNAGKALLLAVDALAQRNALGLGSAAARDAGAAAGQLLLLDELGRLPAVDGSQLTNLPSGGSGTITGSTPTTLTGFLRGNGTDVDAAAFALSDLPAGTLDFQHLQFINSGWSLQFIDQTNYAVNPRFRIQQQPATTITNGAYAFDEWSLLCDPSQSWQAIVTPTGGTTVFGHTSTAGRIVRIGQLNNDRMGLVQVVPNETTRALAGRTARLTCRVRFDAGFGSSTQNVVLTLLAWTGTANAAGARTVTTNLNPWTWASTNHSVVATQTLSVSGNSSTVLSVSGLVPDNATNLVMVISIQSPTANWSANGLLVSQVHLCNSSSRQLWQEPLPSVEEAQCYRRFFRLRDGANPFLAPAQKLNNRSGFGDALLFVSLPVPMAQPPVVTVSNNSHILIRGDDYNLATVQTFQATRLNSAHSSGGLYFTCDGNALWWGFNSSTAWIDFNSRL